MSRPEYGHNSGADPNAIRLPNAWWPRPYQSVPLAFLDRGGGPSGKRYVGVWHRRSGKDDTFMNYAAVQMHRRIGTYWHMLPFATQGRRAVWDSINSQGLRRIDQAFPERIRAATNSSEMKITAHCGSVWQVVGGDNFDALVGSNPVGIIFSEWPLIRPRAWDYLRPILRENGGWAAFIYTPRGRNHGFKMFERARALMKVDPHRWRVDRLGIYDTGVLNDADLDQEREEGMSEQMIEQEYHVSFDAPEEGAYLAAEMAWARKNNRITRVPHQPGAKVDTVWDLGASANNAILFTQTIGMSVQVIHALLGGERGLPGYARKLRELRDENGWEYGDHWAPHDIETSDPGTGERRIDVAKRLGIRFKKIPKTSFEDRLEAGRSLFRVAWIDSGEGCEELVDALFTWREEYDEKRELFKGHPVDDWTCHYADAWTYLGVIRQRLIASAHRAGPTDQPNRGRSRSWDAR